MCIGSHRYRSNTEDSEASRRPSVPTDGNSRIEVPVAPLLPIILYHRNNVSSPLSGYRPFAINTLIIRGISATSPRNSRRASVRSGTSLCIDDRHDFRGFEGGDGNPEVSQQLLDGRFGIKVVRTQRYYRKLFQNP